MERLLMQSLKVPLVLDAMGFVSPSFFSEKGDMDKTKLRQRAVFTRNSLFDEGFLDEQFIQLEELQDDVNPNFAEEIVTLFYSDSVRLIYNIERALIGAKKVKNECTRFSEYCAAENFEGRKNTLFRCFRTFQQINVEYTTLKKKLETYFQENASRDQGVLSVVPEELVALTA
ncbi:hypothetical protein JHK86_014773 [Glycine max]|nr:hypothetical protein JHK86_014773 [Glycine max]